MKTTLMFAVLVTTLLALPAAAQETPDTTKYKSAVVPVWITVQDVDGDSTQVYAMIVWDQGGTKLRFADKLWAGHLVVSLPSAGKDLTNVCAFTNPHMEHGAKPQLLTPDDDKCAALAVGAISTVGVTYLGAPMKCSLGRRSKGKEDAGVRHYGCYWAARPPGG